MTADLKLIVLKVTGEFLFLFGMLAWIYGVIVQLGLPQYQYTELSPLIPWIHVDAFAIVSFIIAAIGFIMWRFAKELSERHC